MPNMTFAQAINSAHVVEMQRDPNIYVAGEDVGGFAAAAVALQHEIAAAALGGQVVLLIEAFPVGIQFEFVDVIDMGQPHRGMIAHADKAGRIDHKEISARGAGR